MGQAPNTQHLLLGLGFSALVLGSGCLVGRPAASLPVAATPAAPARSLAARAPSVAASSATAQAASDAATTDAAVPVIPVLPSDPALPAVAGLRYPLLPADPGAIADLLASLEPALRSSVIPEEQLAALAHQQQVIYRVLAYREDLARQVRAQLPPRWQGVFDQHVAARREFIAMHPRRQRPGQLPAWRIIQPEPAANLLRYYREAAAATGIPWQVLAAVNLVETGMGRIDGISVADARGPMQFLPSTWAEPGIGNGADIRDPRSAIQAAARYLVRRGGLKDISKGLWGYNNSDHYGRAVLHYAALLRDDPAAYAGLYHWQVHFASSAGDLWLPVGYDQSRPIAAVDWLVRQPASRPPAGSSGY